MPSVLSKVLLLATGANALHFTKDGSDTIPDPKCERGVRSSNTSSNTGKGKGKGYPGKGKGKGLKSNQEVCCPADCSNDSGNFCSDYMYADAAEAAYKAGGSETPFVKDSGLSYAGFSTEAEEQAFKAVTEVSSNGMCAAVKEKDGFRKSEAACCPTHIVDRFVNKPAEPKMQIPLCADSGKKPCIIEHIEKKFDMPAVIKDCDDKIAAKARKELNKIVADGKNDVLKNEKAHLEAMEKVDRNAVQRKRLEELKGMTLNFELRIKELKSIIMTAAMKKDCEAN